MGTPRFKINYVDVWKAVRAGLVAIGGAFFAGVMGVVPTLNIATLDIDNVWRVLLLAGCTSVFELLRRYLNDTSGTVTVTGVTQS